MDFIPKLTSDAVDSGVIHKIIPIPGAEAIKWSGELTKKEGIFVGITAGATFAGALSVAEAPKGVNILAMLGDTGERYLSTPLFSNVPTDMTDGELAIHALRQATSSRHRNRPELRAVLSRPRRCASTSRCVIISCRVRDD